MSAILQPLLASMADLPAVYSIRASQFYDGKTFLNQVEERRKTLEAQGLTASDCLCIPMSKRADDWINLLAALSSCAAVVLVSDLTQSKNVLPNWVSIVLKDPGEGGLERLAKPDTTLNRSPDPLLAVQSSGSTGEPKTIWHLLSHFILSAKASNQLLPLTKKDVSLVSLPLNHVGGLGTLFRALVSQSTLAFDVRADDLCALKKTKVTRLSLVPTQLFRLLSQGSPPDKLTVILGGASASETLLSQARSLGWRIHRVYGMSETASQVLMEIQENHWQQLPHAQVYTEDQEIIVTCDSLFLGYGAPAENHQSGEKTRKFATGDLAIWQPPMFKFIGRKDTMFICGGENVFPEAIEKRFFDHFCLEQCVVVPVNDEEWGQRAAMIVALEDGISKDALVKFAEETLSPQERPVTYFRMPATAGLKVSRRKLQQQAGNNDLETIR